MAKLSKLIPTSDYVVVRREEQEKQSKGGILLPENAQKKSRRGIVVAVGPGKFSEGLATSTEDGPLRVPVALCLGDKVVFDQYAGSEVELDDETFLIIRESDILASIE